MQMILKCLIGSNYFDRYWDNDRGEYFIDGHRGTFEAIINWLIAGGPLMRPGTFTNYNLSFLRM